MAKRRAQRLLAGGVSVIGHVLVVAALLTSGLGRGDLISGEGSGDDGAMTVSLVGSGPSDGPQAADTPPAPAADPTQSLLSRLTRQSPTPKPVSTPAARQPASVDELLEEATPRKPQTAGAVDEGAPAVATGQAKAAGGSAALAGRLWAAVAPCWRAMPTSRGAFVRLQVDIDALGRLTAPPRVLRTGQMTLDDRQLLAEADALRALTQCLPKARGLGVIGAHVLDFRDG